MELLSDRIKRVIDVSGMTATALAKAAGCSPAAVQQWISGETKNIKNDLLFAIADATKFEARWIGTGKGPEKIERDTRAEKLADLYAQLDERGKTAVYRVAETESTYMNLENKKDLNAA